MELHQVFSLAATTTLLYTDERERDKEGGKEGVRRREDACRDMVRQSKRGTDSSRVTVTDRVRMLNA